MLEFTVIKPYKESFDGDKVDFYVQPIEDENSVSILTTLEEQVGEDTATEHIEESEDEEDIETEETEDTDEDVEDVSEEEEAESEAEMDELEMGIFDLMNGEDASDEGPEEDDSEEGETGDGWEILGTFYVYKQTNNNDGTVTLQCYDGFQLMNDTYEPAQTKGTFQQFYDDIRSQCQEKGIIVDADTFEEDVYPNLEWNQVCTLREAIGYLAGLLGGFATFGDDNTLGISFFGYDDEVLLTSELLSSTSTSAGETMVDGIICTINLNQDTIESGECGQPLCFYNPFMTQELLDNILEEYQGIRYTGAVVRTSWKPTLIPGEFTRLMTENEYMNYVAMNNALANSSGMTASEIVNLKKEINAVGKSILVSTETVTFGGEAVAEIRSHLMTETEKANAPLSPSDAKFRVVTADLIKTKELIAEKASITDLEATNANIKNLQAADATITGKVTAAEADINSVKADYVKASELDTKVATIANAEIGKANIKDAQIESINGNKIIDGSIVAAALSQEVVKNFRNNNIYYQADAPEGEDLNEGDLWYKTLTKTSGDRAGILFVYDGSGWVNKPFDSESILAKSITAAEIATGTITSSQLAAHTITANEMNMENLQTNIARVGASDGKHLDILTDGIEIKDGTKQLAKYGDSIVIGDEDNKNVIINNSGMEVKNKDNQMFEVKAFGEGETFREFFRDINVDPDSRTEVNVAVGTEIYPAGEPTKVAFKFMDGKEAIVSTNQNAPISYEGYFGGKGQSYILMITIDKMKGDISAYDWTHIAYLYVDYPIAYNPVSVRIGEMATEDEIVEKDGRILYNYRAFKIGRRKAYESEETPQDNAFDVDYKGNTYVGGNLKVNENIQLQGGKSIHDFITDLIYPVGSIYMSVNAANPSTLFGGTWERIKDTFLLSAGDAYSAGASGGSPDAVVVSHTHTQASHTHYTLKGEGWGYPVYNVNKSGISRTRVKTDSSGRFTYLGTSGASSADASNIDWGGQLRSATPTINSTGDSGKGANMPPYLAVYVWKRIS